MERGLSYLVDTNVWLERLLDQERAQEVHDFLDSVPTERLWMTDFTFHSIGLALTRLKRADGLLTFVKDAFVDGAVRLCRLEPQDMTDVVIAAQEADLDFDDAYQYVAALRYDLTLVSFDRDFDRTKRGRKTPAQALVGA